MDLVLGCLVAGDRVVVHCHAGLHRTGFFLYLLLRRDGFTLSQALEALKTTRRKTYEEMTWSKGRCQCLADKAELAFDALFGAPLPQCIQYYEEVELVGSHRRSMDGRDWYDAGGLNATARGDLSRDREDAY